MSDIDLTRRINNLEQRLDNPVLPEVGRWVTWTPTLDQNGAITIIVNYAYYNLINDTVFVIGRVTINSAGSAGSAIILGGLPLAPLNASGTGTDVIGSFSFLDGSTFYVGIAQAVSVTTCAFIADGNVSAIGITPSFAVAVNDVLGFNLVYRR